MVWGHPPHGRATKHIEHCAETGWNCGQFLQPCADEQPEPEQPLLSKESSWVNWPLKKKYFTIEFSLHYNLLTFR